VKANNIKINVHMKQFTNEQQLLFLISTKIQLLCLGNYERQTTCASQSGRHVTRDVQKSKAILIRNELTSSSASVSVIHFFGGGAMSVRCTISPLFFISFTTKSEYLQ